MSNDVQLRYQEIPQNKLQAKIITNWSLNDWILLAIGAALVILSYRWFGIQTTIMVAILVFFPLLRFSQGYGRLYREGAIACRNLYIIVVLGGVLWQARDKSIWIRRWLRGRTPAFPLNLTRVEATIGDKVERFGLIQQTDRPYDHVFIGAGGGAFASLDLNLQMNAVGELADIINREILQSDLKVGNSYLRITGPYNPNKLLVYFRRSMNPFIARPEKFVITDEKKREFAERMLQNAEALRPAMSRAGGATNWFMIVLTIKRPWSLRFRRKPKLSSKELYDLPILELGRSLVDSLQSSTLLGMKNVHCLSLPELAYMARSAWDVTNLNDYFDAQISGEIPLTDEQIDEWRKANPKKDVNIVLKAWPQKRVVISSKHNYIRVDDTWISMLRVVELPKRMRSDQALALHSRMPPGLWTRQAVVAESVSGRAETNQLVIGTSALMNLQSAFMANRVVENPFLNMKKRELSKQTETISAHSLAQHFNMIVPILASSEEELLTQRKIVRGVLNALQLRAVVVEGAYLQREAFISGAFGINRL